MLRLREFASGEGLRRSGFNSKVRADLNRDSLTFWHEAHSLKDRRCQMSGGSEQERGELAAC